MTSKHKPDKSFLPLSCLFSVFYHSRRKTRIGRDTGMAPSTCEYPLSLAALLGAIFSLRYVFGIFVGKHMSLCLAPLFLVGLLVCFALLSWCFCSSWLVFPGHRNLCRTCTLAHCEVRVGRDRVSMNHMKVSATLAPAPFSGCFMAWKIFGWAEWITLWFGEQEIRGLLYAHDMVLLSQTRNSLMSLKGNVAHNESL